MSALVVAILGAESTGKTTLAQDLAARVTKECELPCTWVPEVLRQWCDEHGRTPQPEEQAAIAKEQHAQIARAAAAHAVVIADTSALMTAVYSRLIFSDLTLLRPALELHRAQVSHSLLTALDLPWVADGHQRDGPQVREPVDAALREWLSDHRLPWSLVSGTGATRVDNALDAMAPLLRPLAAPRTGLFSRLEQRNARSAQWRWVCETCDEPDCEHALRLAG